MADEKQLAILRQGFQVWNAWRDTKPASFVADLSGANLAMADYLSMANLSMVNLRRAILRGADLSMVKLRGAILCETDLSRAYGGADFRKADFSGANLTEADLRWADLREADFSGAGFGKEAQHRAYGAANLCGTDLREANLWGAELSMADLGEAILSNTILAGLDLSKCKGLECCVYRGPSIIDHRTLQLSVSLPLPFLRGVGLPDRLIDYLPSLLGQVLEFYSCFISYSSKNQAFADRLHADLQANGVRCWFAPHDMPIGAKTIDAIDEAIRLRDKVLLLLSKDAIASDWVEGEVTRGLAEERKRKQLVLVPIRIDNAVFKTEEAWARLLQDQRNIGDFTRWKDHDVYSKSLQRLLRDLKVAADGQPPAG